MLIRSRLLLLIGLAIAGLVILGGVALSIKQNLAGALEETVDVRLPSVLGLEILNEAQTNIARRSLQTAIWENDYTRAAQQNFQKTVTDKAAAWSAAEAGWRMYEPLPQTSEEALLWKQFVEDWTAWKALDAKVTAEMSVLAAGQSEIGQKEAFKRFYAAFEAQEKPFEKAEASLQKVIDINMAIARTASGEAKTAVARASMLIWLSFVVCCSMALTLGWWIYRGIMHPLTAMQGAMKRIGEHSDLRERVGIQSHDEVGQAAQVFNTLMSHLQASFSEILMRMGEVRHEVANLATAAHEVSHATAHQASAASSMAAAVQEVTVSINHVSDSAAEALALSKTAEDRSADGIRTINGSVDRMSEISNTVGQASTAIAELGRQSDQISAVVQVIKDIADQTNLLALNAAIEAARAGDQGRGFAVVADEVRKLAERTTQSTVEIATMISSVQSSSQAAVDEMQQVVRQVAQGQEMTRSAGAQIVTIGEETERAAEAISGITVALREQSAASNEIASHVEAVAQMTEENHAASERTAESARRVDQLAENVLSTISAYKV